MRLVVAAVGRVKAGPERDLVDRYLTRSRAMLRAAGFTGLDAWDVDEGRGRTAEDRKREEAAALLGRLGSECLIMAFDERGEAAPSARFAAILGRERDGGTASVALVVGGPDGFADAFREKARFVVGFGAATLPHQLVRVIVAEQIYRALTILTGHPYHRP